jgi:hypothetical protein
MTSAQASSLHTTSSTSVTLEALRQQGAARFDAVACYYIEVLSTKLSAHQGAAHSSLQSKIDTALNELQARMSAVSTLTPPPKPVPSASPLAQLLHELAPPADPALTRGRRAENLRVAQFRKTLSQLSVQKQVSHAIAQAPHNAGPINSHMLVLRSLGLMRQRSPDYLNRFMGYVDTLLCLKAAGKAKPVKPNTAASAKVKAKK